MTRLLRLFCAAGCLLCMGSFALAQKVSAASENTLYAELAKAPRKAACVGIRWSAIPRPSQLAPSSSSSIAPNVMEKPARAAMAQRKDLACEYRKCSRRRRERCSGS